jgi:hypothetical protein
VLSFTMTFHLVLHALVCSAGLALAAFPTGSYANEVGMAGGVVSRHHPDTPVKDGYYGIFDPTLPTYASMWDPIVVSQERVVYDGAYIDDYGCKDDTTESGSVSRDQCYRITSLNGYRQLNTIQIERITPGRKLSVLTWYKQLD